jgi:RNA polymerase sigma-70 factor (ECF subfamily)
VLESEPDNSNLSRLIKEGDARSYELLFRRLYPRLCAYAQKFVLDSDVSEEIVQGLFHSLWEHRDRIDENQSLHAYLFTSVKNRSLNFLESKKSRSKHAELLWYLYVQRSTENDNTYQSLLLNDLEKDLNTALAHLPKECKRIFELSRFEGLKYQEIAQRLNISNTNVAGAYQAATGTSRTPFGVGRILSDKLKLLSLSGYIPALPVLVV